MNGGVKSWVRYLVIVLTMMVSPAPVFAQQPFLTDDANVTPKGKLHFEFTNEFDILQRSSFPNLKQNTSSFTLNYGLVERVEIGINTPLITIFNAHGQSPRMAFGFGDTELAIKYYFREERDGSRLPAMAVSFNLELPTGDKDRQLGSALVDYQLNGIAQKSLTERTMLRLNGGVIFSGNTLTGARGIKTRGTVFTGGVSLVRQITEGLDLGVEATGAVTKELQLGKGLLQFQIGGNYRVKEGLSLDFGIIGGRYPASPRAGLQLGFTVDF